jgi:L-fuculose-phosphate aldolase
MCEGRIVSAASLRAKLLATARRMNALGLNQGTSGNLSVRTGTGFLITPSGLPYATCRPADMVAMTMDGTWRGRRRPSSEWRFHRDLLAARAEIGAVLHAHATFATTLACLGKGIPAFHYMVAVAGGAEIRCAPYATFGTEALSRHVVRAIEGRTACLMAHHGLIVLGADLDDALARAIEIEKLAEIYWRALQAGRPKTLSADEMRIVLEKFKDYGRNAQAARAGGTPRPRRAATRARKSAAGREDGSR